MMPLHSISDQTKKVVIIDEPGQMCNQLWAYSPIMAFCSAKKIPLTIYGFNSYLELFVESIDRNVNFLDQKSTSKALLKVIKTGLKIKRIFGLPSQSIEISGTVFVKSWAFSKPLHQASFLKIFHQYAIKHFRLPLMVHKSLGVNRVGLHIRRGDYATWLGGRYFYSLEQYREQAISLAERLFPNQDVEFLIASNEDVSEFAKTLPNSIYFKDNSPLEDLALLASSSVIVGPPSTFSMWASFYSQVPIWFIKTSDSPPPDRLPPYIVYQDVFSDGTTLSVEN